MVMGGDSISDHKEKQFDAVLEALNAAVESDPAAVSCLLSNMVPCTVELANHPSVVVEKGGTTDKAYWRVGMLGFINAVLSEAGLPRICSAWSKEKDETGRYKFAGFQKWVPPQKPNYDAFLKWNEPPADDGDGCVRRATVREVIEMRREELAAQGVLTSRSDKQLLNEFVTTHWAWFEKDEK